MTEQHSRTLAIGDIHGCDVAFENLIETVQPSASDTLVILGDVVDRGPNTRRCVQLLHELSEICQLVFLMGNHEEMMLRAVHDRMWMETWLHYGGVETMQSYGSSFSDIPERHVEFLRAGKPYFQTEKDIFVHANLEPETPLAKQETRWLRWKHLTGDEQPFFTGKRVICGHARQSSGLPALLTGWVCIDTSACSGQFLTCLDVDRDIIHRTTQSGDIERDLPLNEIAVSFVPR
ncbi:MAG: metallophosphoesterase family protein [Planctomycetaceae bacterium]